MVVGQGGLVWLKWIPYKGLITCNGKVIGGFGLDRIPIGDTNRLNLIIQPLEKHVLYGLIML